MASNYGTGGATVSRKHRRTGRKRRVSLAQLNSRLIGSGSEFIYRWQNTTATYVGPGRLQIGWTRTIDGLIDNLPIHFMSLTNLTHHSANANVAKGCVTQGMHRTGYYTTTKDVVCNPLPNQTNQGVANNDGLWQQDLNSAIPNTFNARVFHKWTDIKLNLYGTYSVPIHYHVFLCQMPEQLDPFSVAPGSFHVYGSEFANMIRDISGGLLYSSVGGNSYKKWPSDVRIVKQHRVTIQPLTYSDQAAERGLEPTLTSDAPHIHELRWFVRHDRHRDYHWSENTGDMISQNNYATAGWDINNPKQTMSDCEWGKKLFLFITATAPGSTVAGSEFPSGNDVRIHGSYDVNVRNCFRTWVN